jgi:V8-like Glu-specific endopeptidase
MMNPRKNLVRLLKEFNKLQTEMNPHRITHMASEVSPIKASAFEYKPAYVTPDIIESMCGFTDESQPVEHYDGTLGVSRNFVDEHQPKVAQIQWNNDLSSKYRDPGNVSDVRWGSGIMIADNLFLTAGHCFDSDANGWRVPRSNDTNNLITPPEIAINMHLNFNYQLDQDNNLRSEIQFKVLDLVEYRQGSLDYAILKIDGSPGSQFGVARIASDDAPEGDMVAIIGHPEGRPKTIEAGPITDYTDFRVGYNSIDTFGGSSGSGILHYATGKIVGVHTNGGCGNGGFNYGQRISSLIQVSQTIANILN